MTIRPLREVDFQQHVTDLAEICGWQWIHFRPARTERGWRTPVSGPMGQGWVDLVLVRARDRRMIFAELKADRGKLSPDQERVLAVLRSIESTGMAYRELGIQLEQVGPRVEVYVWRPRDFDQVREVLA